MIDPRGLTVVEWCDRMIPALESYGTIGRLDNPDEWRDWARRAYNLTASLRQNVPSPDWFSDWQDWANAFNLIFDSGY